MPTNETTPNQTELFDKRGDCLVASILCFGVIVALFVARIFTEGAAGFHEVMSFAIPVVAAFLLFFSVQLVRNEYRIARIGADIEKETGAKVFLIVGYAASAFALISILVSFV